MVEGLAALVLFVGTGMALAGPLAARAFAADSVKYYAVAASYGGKPENLSEIALRFLGASERTNEIFALNVGRKQPDGGALTDPSSLHVGWYLQLPWDAVGDGVRYGELPTTAPVPKVSTTAPRAVTTAKPAPVAASGPPATVSSGAQPGPVGSCAVAPVSSRGSNWAALRMAASQAWTRTRGKGVVVAIIDSGVDESLPQLTGHVAVGADIVNGSGRGATDCLGSGTAMAGIIVGQPDQISSLDGMAPEATVLPIRIVTTTPKALVSDQASGIQVAVSAGASVLALGAYVDIDDPTVAQAVADAVKHNVVVVAGASTLASAAAGRAIEGALRVGGIGVDNKAAVDYRPGGVDVVAPGVDIPILGISGTGQQAGSGTQLAVAYVAGEVGLVRAAHPNLTAAQVVHRVEATADKQGATVPDQTYGWGLINPSAAVIQVLAEEQHTAAPSAATRASGSGGFASSTGRTAAVVLIALIGLAVAAVFAFRIHHIVRTASGQSGGAEDTGPQGAGRIDEDQNYGDWHDDAVWSDDPRGANGEEDVGGAETARPMAYRSE